jgi:hypothetical protein
MTEGNQFQTVVPHSLERLNTLQSESNIPSDSSPAKVNSERTMPNNTHTVDSARTRVSTRVHRYTKSAPYPIPSIIVPQQRESRAVTTRDEQKKPIH